MRITILFLFWSVPALILPAQNRTSFIMEETDGPTPWTSTDFNDDPQEFQFAIVTDRTGGHRPGVFMQGIEKLNLMQPEFVMSVGDLIEGYSKDTARLQAEWDEFEGFIDHLEMPFFYVPGNHDKTNDEMARIWRERFGLAHYHFLYKDVLFLCLDSEDMLRGSGMGSISDAQFEYARSVLEEYEEVRYTFVFMHQPLWIQVADPKRWADLEQILTRRPHTVFVGHHHNYVKYDRNEGEYYILATTGGGSNLRGPVMGEFDQVVWVTMKQDGPRIANLLLEGILDEDVLRSEKKQFLSAVQRSNPIEVEPLFVETSDFDQGKVLFTLNNQQTLPMEVKLTEGFSWDIGSSMDRDLIVLAPGTSVTLAVDLYNRNQLPLEQLRPLPVHFQLSFDSEETGQIAIPASYRVKPLQKRFVKRPAAEITVNADLSDWQGAWYDFQDSKSDNKISWLIAYDDTFIYLAAQVEDDTVLVDPTLPTWKQDGFGWMIALGADHSLSTQRGAGTFRITPSKGDIRQACYRSEHWPEELQYFSKSDESGYTVEARIPIRLLYRDSNPWTQIRINFFMDDKDSPSDPARIYWQHPWRGAGAVVGSGVFWRE
jgi:predicted phosphodiesterase